MALHPSYRCFILSLLPSFPVDLFYGHISGMDAMARGLRNAARMIGEGELDRMRRERYSSYFDDRIGRCVPPYRSSAWAGKGYGVLLSAASLVPFLLGPFS